MQSVLIRAALALSMFTLTGCELPSREAEVQAQNPGTGQGSRLTPVDVAIARIGSLGDAPEYTATTAPDQEVLLRPQIEAQLLNLNVDVGDAVKRGQVLARLDDSLLVSAVNEAEAELAAQSAEVAQAQAQVNDALARVDAARLELQQAAADAARQQQLFRQGAIAAQSAEQSQTLARTSAQTLRSAQQQVRVAQRTVTATQRRVTAQQAVVVQAQKRLSYAVLTSPISGVVLEKLTEPGNLLQPGGEVLRLGDFSRVKVVVQVSELELANIQVGQTVQVRLDAFPNQQLQGEVRRISPAAEPTARLIPVEVIIPNRNGRIGSGLLARVSFSQQGQEIIVVPQTALPDRSSRTLFIVTGNGEQSKVAARSVTLGKRANGQVEILSGLKVGERFVARSGKPLKDGDQVRLSIISEETESGV